MPSSTQPPGLDLVDLLPFGVAVVDSDGHLVQANRAFARLLQAPRRPGTPIAAVLPIPPDILAAELAECCLGRPAELPLGKSPGGHWLMFQLTPAAAEGAVLSVTPCHAPPDQQAEDTVATLSQALRSGALPALERARVALSQRRGATCLLEPDPAKPWSPAEVVRTVVAGSAPGLAISLDATIPPLCVGDYSVMATLLGALVAHAPRDGRLSAVYVASTGTLRASVAAGDAEAPSVELQAVAARFGGQLAFDQGSLTITTQLEPAPKPAVEAPPARDRAPLLVIEDDPVTAMVVRAQVERLGIEVDQARTGRAGLDQARQRHYRTVLLDCLLPDMDGRAVYELLRSLPLDRRPDRIIATSSLVNGKLPGGMATADVDAVLAKPIALDDLRAALEPHLFRSSAPLPDAGANLPVLDPRTLGALHGASETPESVDRVLTRFLVDLDQGRDALVHSMRAADLLATAQAAQRLRGAAAAVGAARVAQLCRLLEGVGSTGSVQLAAPMVDRLVAESKAVEHAIAARYV